MHRDFSIGRIPAQIFDGNIQKHVQVNLGTLPIHMTLIILKRCSLALLYMNPPPVRGMRLSIGYFDASLSAACKCCEFLRHHSPGSMPLFLIVRVRRPTTRPHQVRVRQRRGISWRGVDGEGDTGQRTSTRPTVSCLTSPGCGRSLTATTSPPAGCQVDQPGRGHAWSRASWRGQG